MGKSGRKFLRLLTTNRAKCESRHEWLERKLAVRSQCDGGITP